MKALLALLWLCANLVAQAITIENVARVAQDHWAIAPLPVAAKNGKYLFDGGFAIVDRNIAFLRAPMEASERKVLKLTPAEPEGAYVYNFHPLVIDDIWKLIPSFVVEKDGTTHRSDPAYPVLVDAGAARWRFDLSTRIPQVPLMIKGHFYVYSDDPVIEFEIRCSYGSTVVGPNSVDLGNLIMEIGERPTVDYASRKGLAMAQTSGAGWTQQLSIPRSWYRARTIEVTGAIMCGGKEPLVDEQPRMDGPVMAISHDWDGHFGAIGRVPSASGQTWAVAEQAKRRAAFESGRTQIGDELDARPYAQPPASGTTGEQADFGVIRGEHIRLDTGKPEPWAIYDARFSTQAWMLRTYANREANGAVVLKKNHPQAVLYNLRPDERISRTDPLGWSMPVGWISGYATSDSQHRSDNWLAVMWMLTRSASVEDTIRDIIELQKMELRREPTPGGGASSPRGWGRPLLSMCHLYSCGFYEVAPIIKQMVADVWTARAYASYPEGSPLLTFSDREAKYGWNDESGKPINTATLPWQDSILCKGLYAAWCQLKIPEARQMVIDVGSSIGRWAFYMHEGKLYHCYAIRLNPTSPGHPPAAEHFLPGQPNYWIYTDGSCSSWTVASQHMLMALDGIPDDVKDRAKFLIKAFGPPAHWGHACWWAF